MLRVPMQFSLTIQSLVLSLIRSIRRAPLLLAVLILPGGCFLLPPLTVILERRKAKVESAKLKVEGFPTG